MSGYNATLILLSMLLVFFLFVFFSLSLKSLILIVLMKNFYWLVYWLQSKPTKLTKEMYI